MTMHLRILDLLPRTDCQKCGRNTCLAFAGEVAERLACVEACPELSDESERALRSVIAAEHEMISWLGGMISGISRSNMRSALAILREVLLLFPARVAGLLLFTLPLTYPFLVVGLMLYNR